MVDPVLALLVLGTVLADFLLAPLEANEPERPRQGLARHGALVALVLGGLVLPVHPSVGGLLLVVPVAVGHACIHALRARMEERWPERRLSFVFGDLAMQGVVLVAARLVWPGADEVGPSWIGTAALVVAAFVFNANGGSAVVGAVLQKLEAPRSGDDGPAGAGRMIGILERWMVLGLVCLGEWGAVGLVLTAKSVARFKKMEDQAFAEVYLVGTMTSVLVAMASGLVLRSVCT